MLRKHSRLPQKSWLGGPPMTEGSFPVGSFSWRLRVSNDALVMLGLRSCSIDPFVRS